MSAEAEDSLAIAMAAAQQGDAVAYRQLLQRCVPVIAGVARAQGFRGAAVDDVVQETLMTVHRVRHTYDPTRPFLPWLRAIAQRRAIDGLRQQARRRAREIQDPLRYDSHADPRDSAEQDLDRQDQRRQLAGALADLPAAQREAVTHLATGGKSLDQTAAETGRSKGALKVNLHRAIKALRLRLGQEPDDGR